jgi:hypothetical protein
VLLEKYAGFALRKVGHPDKIDWVITLQDWAEIRHLHGAEGMSIRAIAVRLGVSRDAVSRAGNSVVSFAWSVARHSNGR